MTDVPAIAFSHVAKRFGTRHVVTDLSLTIPARSTTVILGPSGTGKSTLLRMATGLLAPDAGHVHTLGDDVFALRRAGLFALRQRIGVLFQDNALFSSLSVRDNVMFPLLRVAKRTVKQSAERADSLLELVGLHDVGRRMPDALSGGQRKRVALARAIALEPELVLFDEPTAGLDPQTSASIDALIVDMQQRLKCAFVVITHDVISARAIAHHVGVLWGGELLAFAAADAVFASTHPTVRAFLDRTVDRKPASG